MPLKSGMNELPDPDRRKPDAAIPLTNQGLFHWWDPAPNWWAKRHEAKLRELASYGPEIDIVMLGDFLHPKEPGYDIWAEEVAPYFKQIVDFPSIPR